MDDKSKTGVFTGAFATNPLTGRPIPVFVADYVLMGYGTGAIMAVPGQDERDWAYAVAYDLPIIRTVQPAAGHPEDEAYVGEGPAINSANDEISLDGLGVGRRQGAHHRVPRVPARQSGTGRSTTGCATGCSAASATGASRSRSSIDEDGTAHALPVSMLPLALPEVPDYAPEDLRPRGRRQLAGAPAVAGPRLGRGGARPGRRARAATGTAERPTRCPTGPDRAGTTCDTSTRPTTTPSATRRTSATGWPGTRIPSRAHPRSHRPRRRRPLHRRRRARGAAPALRPVLAQGAVRPGAGVEWSRSGSTSRRA